jgi:GGDEF domain-containing protein
VRGKLTSEALRELQLIDPTTGFYTEQGLLRKLGELAAGAARHRRPLGVVVLALEVGSADGSGSDRRREGPDRELAELLRRAQRASDAVGVLGERQFVILAPDTGEEGVVKLAERLRSALAGSGSDEYLPSPPALRFGCYAVPDFAKAAIAPRELLLRAAAASRQSAGASESVIRFFTPHSN